jgi:tRNA A-37 threonylcarbamoyl transferase component Bud32/tetratricopeptide (TPR) repeat protein
MPTHLPDDMDRDPVLIEVLRAIAEGTPIDWLSLEASRSGESFREAISDLKVVAEVANLHRSLNEPGSLSTSSTADDGTGASVPSHPATWGPLTLVNRVGAGAFGEVYRAWDTRLEREVALKLLRRGDAAAGGANSRAVHEGRLLARVRHPNIVTVYGADVIDGRAGIWMEFVEGETLEAELKAHGPLPVPELVRIGLALCRALAAVHDAGFVHRDIKAQNVLRDKSGRVVLGDFGTGHEVEESDAPRLAGTPVYLAPEVLNRAAATTQSDIYSLGVLLYHLATGSFPVRGGSVRELREAHTTGNTTPLRDHRIDLPSSFVDAVERAIASDPSQRFTDARAFEAALTRRPFRRIVLPIMAIILLGAAATLGRARLNPPATPTVAAPRAFFAGIRNEGDNHAVDRIVADEMTRALSGAGILAPISHEQVTAVLRSLNEPDDVPLEGSLPFEIAARYGNIPAVVETEIRRAGAGYRFLTTLWNAGDLRFSTDSIYEDNIDPQQVNAAARKHAATVVEALRRGSVKFVPAESPSDLVRTRSTMALNMYAGSYMVFRQGGAAQRSISPAKSAVDADPDFASGWIWLAWMVRNAALQADPEVSEGDPVFRSTFSSYVEKAMVLAPSAPEWEQHWIRGSRAYLYGDKAASIPEYLALLELRPNYYYSVNNLLNALTSALPAIGDPSERSAIVARAKRVLPSARWRTCCAWFEWLPAYDAWRAGDVDAVLSQVNQAVAMLDRRSSSEPLSPAAGYFALALGRMHTAERLFEKTDHPSGAEGRKLDLLLLAELREDQAEMKRLLAAYPKGPNARPSRFIRAGLLDEARAALNQPVPSENFGPGRFALGRGQLLMLDNRVEEALPLLRAGMEGLASSPHREYYEACDAVARSLKRLGRSREMLATLEECTAEPPTFTTAFFSGATPWMTLKLDVARLYRAAGRSSAADAIERDIRHRLQYADPDYPVLVRLNAGN